MTPEELLEKSQYISLATLRKNGEFVNTPVWFAGANKVYYVFSSNPAGKVKRLRNFSTAKIAPCNVSGMLKGDWFDASAHLFDSTQEVEHAHDLLQDKYGWQLNLLDFFSRLGGKINQRAYIRINLN